MEQLNLTWKTFKLAYDNNIMSLGNFPSQSNVKAHLQLVLIEKYKIFVNADVCINTGNFEYFIHDLNVSVEDAQNEKYAELIEESKGYDFPDYYSALEQGLFRAVEYIISKKVE